MRRAQMQRSALNKRERQRRKGSPMGSPSHINSLTMSYFHTGIRTIIGAEAFHCPVRDGKEWDHLAMVIRHDLLLIPKEDQPI